MKTALIRGAGDLASGVASQLHKAGWRILMTELARPLCVRCRVSFARAVYEGSCRVEDMEARFLDSLCQWETLPPRLIGVTIAPYAQALAACSPELVVDGAMAKRDLGLSRDDGEIVIALGPGYTAGVNCHAVIETMRGPDLGRPIYEGCAAADTGVPGLVGGAASERVLRAPVAGIFQPCSVIGDMVRPGQVLARVEGRPVRASIGGVLRGLLPQGTPVTAGLKCGDVDPRGRRELCFTISDKAERIGRGVLEAVEQLTNNRS